MDIVIIESPNKKAKIAEIMGADVYATVGHFKELKSLDAINLETYEAKFTMVEQKRPNIEKIKAACKDKKVYIATDDDREGYAIGTLMYDEIKHIAKECWRLAIREITEKGIKEALSQAVRWEETNVGLYNSFLGRREADIMIGYLMSPKANSALNGKYSVGRVQSPATRMIVEREREIKNFKPVQYFTIDAIIHHRNGDFGAKYVTDKQILAQSEAEELKSKMTGNATITKIEAVQSKQSPKAPFTTLDLQTTCSTKLNLTAERTMEAAQALFEKGLITYHRTDSSRLSDEFIGEVRELITQNFDKEYLSETVRVYKSKHSQADAHEAIRPSHVHSLDDVKEISEKESLSDIQTKVYDLIFKHTIATQMSDVLSDVTKVTLSINNYEFFASGKIQKFDGYLKLYGEEVEEEETEKEGKLPLIEKGDNCPNDIEVNAKMTKPKPRLTEATLLRWLEKEEIGRPSTYAGILNKIIDEKRQYAKVEKKKLFAEVKGENLISYLEDKESWLIDYKYTADMEKYLDDIEEGVAGKTTFNFLKDLHERLGFVKPSDFSRPPSEKQIEWAKKLALENEVELDAAILLDMKLTSDFIDKYKAPTQAKGDSICKCLLCKKGDVYENIKAFQCNNCKVAVWKESYGAKFTKDDAKSLFGGKSITRDDLISQKNPDKPYSATLKFSKGKIDMKFEDKK